MAALGTESVLGTSVLAVAAAVAGLAGAAELAGEAAGHDSVLAVFRAQVLELPMQLVVDDGVLLDPADFLFVGADFVEALAALDHFQPLSVGHQGDTVRYSGHAVVKIDLARRHVDVIVLLVVEAGATGGHRENRQQAGRQSAGKASGLAASGKE